MIRHQSLVRHPPPEVPDGDTTGDDKAAEDADVKKSIPTKNQSSQEETRRKGRWPEIQ